jgi:hypothetical protein
MSTIGSPVEASLIQTAQAQQQASRARDREKARTESARPLQDRLELRVAGVEEPGAVRALPHNDSEQAHDEQRRHAPPEERPRVDLKA